MAKKKDKIRRRRQITRTRQGTERPERKPSPPPVAKEAEKTTMKDVWIALAIVAGVVVLFMALYHFAVRQPPSQAEPEPTVAPSSMSWDEPPPMTLDTSKSYEAVIHTEKGDVRIALYDDLAPVTVNNFIFLARQGFYDGVTFHRVIPGFMAQTGDPTGTGSGGPGYRFDDEFDPSLRHDAAGVVSMANAGPNTNGSQFFITYAPAPHLDDQHTIFGRVIEGMEVVESLTPRSPAEDPDAPAGDRILSIEIIEVG